MIKAFLVAVICGLFALYMGRNDRLKDAGVKPLEPIMLKGCFLYVAAMLGLLLCFLLFTSWQVYRESGRIPFIDPADCTDLPEQTPETALAALRKTLLDTPKTHSEFLALGGTMDMFERPTLIVGYQQCPPQPSMRFFIEKELENRPGTPWFFWGPRQWRIGVSSALAQPCPNCTESRERLVVSALVSRCGIVWEMRVRKYTTQCAPPPATPK
jgi:hypothetical protein